MKAANQTSCGAGGSKPARIPNPPEKETGSAPAPGRHLACWLACLISCLVLGLAGRSKAAEATWQPTVWSGEKALVSIHEGWKAIVSLERGRLVHFGPVDSGDNLLFATPTREDPAGWGGHRLWLGPQTTWSKIWPPPAAWEHSAPESFTADGEQLRLVMPDAGDGWPRLTRTYRWDGRHLICGAEVTGGTRNFQVIQIVQVPSSSRINVTATAEPTAPAGYVRLPAGSVTQLTAEFKPPPQVVREGNRLWLHYTGETEKLGFRPQTLAGHESAKTTVRIGRENQSGEVAGEPDLGFYSQVFLGGHEPFIELEQLSQLFLPGETAVFEISIGGDTSTSAS